MSKRSVVTPKDPSQHPAVLAFQEVFNTTTIPSSIEILQGPKCGREVWRLIGCGATGESLIAKRCAVDDAVRERDFYQQLLPKLPVLPVRFLGYVEIPVDSETAWIFLEDVSGDEPYSTQDPEQRKLAGHWIGRLHTSGRFLSPEDRFLMQDRGPGHFRQFVDQIASAVPEHRCNPALSEADRKVLDETAARCDLIGSHWAELAAYCRRMPQGVIHGDLKQQHILWCRRPDGRVLRLIDWAQGGWGSLALDLVRFLGHRVAADVNLYLETVREREPAMSLEELYRLFYVGQLFVVLDSVRWEVERLRYPWVDAPMSNLRLYRDWMEEIVQAAPWSDEPSLFEKRQPKLRPWD